MTAIDAPAGRRARGGRDPNLIRLLVMLVFVFVLMTILRPGQFATLADFNSMMRQFPEYGIMAIGMSLTMITGGIDLGVVGTANLSAIVAATFLIGTVPVLSLIHIFGVYVRRRRNFSTAAALRGYAIRLAAEFKRLAPAGGPDCLGRPARVSALRATSGRARTSTSPRRPRR